MKKIIKQIGILILVVAIGIVQLPVTSFVVKAENSTTDLERYTVLILDTSGSMDGTPETVQKEAAIKFCDSMLKAEGTNNISILKLNSTSSVACDFTNNIETLTNCINNISSSGGTDINEALQKAGELLDSIEGKGNSKAIKNIVLCSDGYAEEGEKSTSGKYTESDHKTGYKYANVIYNTSITLKEKGYNLYCLGFFHSLQGDNLSFARLVLSDVADEGNYHEVVNVEDLEFVFGDIADNINADTLKELYVQQHMNYIRNDKYKSDIILGYAPYLDSVLDDALVDTEVRDYDILKALNNCAEIDIKLDEQDSYELLLAQLLYSEQSRTQIQELYNSNLLAQAIDTLKLIVDEMGEDSVARVKCEKLMQDLNSADFGSIAYQNTFSELMDELAEQFTPKQLVNSLSDLTFVAGVGIDFITESFNTVKDIIEYVVYGQAYVNTSEDFRDVLLRLYMIAEGYVGPDDFVDRIGAWNSAMNLSSFRGALHEFIVELEDYRISGAKAVAEYALETAKKGASNFAEEVVKDVIVECADTICSYIPILNVIPAVKTGLAVNKLLIDVFTNIDERAYSIDMLTKLYCMIYMMYYVVETYEDDLIESKEFTMAARFDESINVYKTVLSIAADYGAKYEKQLLIDELLKPYPASAKKTSWYSTAISTMATQKLLIEDIKCHSEGLLYDHNTKEITYDSTKLKVFTVACPVEVVVKNLSGNQIALLGDENNEIEPGYEKYFYTISLDNTNEEKAKVAIVPDDYEVEIYGKSEGSMDVYVSDYDGNSVGNTIVFSNIEVTESTKGNFENSETNEGVIDLVIDEEIYVGEIFKERSTGTCGGSVEYTWWTNGLLEIYGEGDMPNYTVGGMDGVVQFGSPWYMSVTVFGTLINAIEISEGVTSIGGEAFLKCKDVTHVIIPESVRSIGYNSFQECTSLKRITIPSGIKWIDSFAFGGCSELKEIYFTGDAPSISDTSFGGVTANVYYPANNETWTSDKLQNYGGTLTWIPYEDDVIASGVSGELKWTFAEDGTITISGEGPMVDYDSDNNAPWVEYANDITGVVIEEGVTRIGNFAFRSGTLYGVKAVTYPNIEYVCLPSTLTEIGEYSFTDCTSLREIILPDNVEIIGKEAFLGSGLEKITWGKALETIGEHAFEGSFIGEVNLPDTVQNIGQYAFCWCKELKDVSIPDGCNINKKAFYGCDLLENVKIGRNCTIGSYIFKDCISLRQISIGEESRVIKSQQNDTEFGFVFQGCTALESITLPDSWGFYDGTTENKNYTLQFDGCTNLKEVILNDTNEKYVNIDNIIYTKDGKTMVYYPLGIIDQEYEIREGTEIIGYFAFDGQPYLEYVEIPNTVTKIQSHAFSRSGIKSVIVPDSVLEVENAFYQCNNLKQVAMSKNVTELVQQGKQSIETFNPYPEIMYGVPGSYAEEFAKEHGITIEERTEIQFNSNGGKIKESDAYKVVIKNEPYRTLPTAAREGYIFEGWYTEKDGGSKVIENAIVTGNKTLYAHWARISEEIASGWSGYTTWSLTSDGVITFSGEGAMKNYATKDGMPWYKYRDQITSVVIEDGVTTIGEYAFYGMPAMESITIPDSVTNIGAFAFKNAKALKSVELPEKLAKLGESAFYECTALTSIEIPANLWTIQPYTFKNCTALREVVLNEGNLQKISDGAFYNTGLTKVVLPDCLDILDVYAFKNCTQLADITIGTGLTELREAVFYGTPISTITIPEGITKVGPYVFKNCTKLTTVELPESLTSIGEAAFYACAELESIDLPDAVTKIGNYAFRKCEGLTSVKMGSGLTMIGESSFYGCTGLTTLNIPRNVETIMGYAFKGCTNLKEVTLSNNLLTIGESAFHTCTSLTEVTIPRKVKGIGEYCFSGSTAIKEFTFNGNAPAIGTGAFNKITAKAYYPADDDTWTSSVKQNYGGNISWIAE